MKPPQQTVIDFGAPLRALPYWKRKIASVATLAILGHTVWLETLPRNPDDPARAFLLTLALFAAAVVLQELLRPKQNIEDAKPAGIDDFDFPTATEGRVVPLLFGRNKITGPNVVWYGDLLQDGIVETVKTGLWSKESHIKGWSYRVGFQFAMSRGDDATPTTLRTVWIGEDEVYAGAITDGQRFDIDKPDLFGGNDMGRGGVQATCDFYGGTTTQAVNAYLDDPSRQQIAMTTATDTAPRYTNTCHLVIREMTSAAPAATNKGAYVGNSTSIPAWAFEMDRYPAKFSTQTGTENIIGVDCNPMNVIYEVLTNADWGFGFPAADVDVADSFIRASDSLIAEGNGFSMIVGKEMTAADFLALLEDQIGGVLFLNQRTGLWSINLARESAHTYFGWNINTVPQLTDSNVKTVADFTRGSFEDTTNQIAVQFAKRDDEYKESYAMAQDMANAMIQGGGTVTSRKLVSAQKNYPGVKDSDLASNLAWRELRNQSFPLARAKFTVNRQFWDVKVGDVVAWTTGKLGFSKLPMRVMEIDYGLLQDNKMTMMLVQDVFSFAAASYGSPAATEWVAPAVALAAYPTTDQAAQEAPRALITRSPDYLGDPNISRIHCAANHYGGEAMFDITQRNHPTSTSGSFFEAGSVVQFSLMGELNVALAAGTVIPTAAITITPSDDSQAALVAAFDDGATPADMGQSLSHLIKVGNEYMLVTTASTNGANVDLEDVYRGVLDSGQVSHAAGTKVWLIFTGSGLSNTSFPNTNVVDIALRMRSASDRFAGAVTNISQSMDQRTIRPYPPAALLYSGGGTEFTAPDLEADGSGLNGVGFDVDWWRRNFTTTDEVLSALSDDTTVDASTEYRTSIYVDPDGSNVLAHQSSWATGTSLGTRPTQVEIVNEAAAGTKIRVRIEVRHDYSDAKDTELALEGRYSLDHDVTPTSSRSSEFYLGGDLSAAVTSNSYTSVANGTFVVTIGALMNSQIQYRINGGSWVNLTGYTPNVNLTGTIAGVVSTDTIELKHLTNAGPARVFVELQNPSATPVAYGVMTDAT